jgi:DNA-binding PadR family transcriptional regulator
MAFKTDLEALILGAVAERPLHGYGIVKVIKDGSQGALKAGEGQLYPILHKMEEQGWLASEWEPQEGRPPRKLYHITDGGQAELADRKKSWMQFSKAVSSILHTKEANGHA